MTEQRLSRGQSVLVIVGRKERATEQPATVLKTNGSTLLVQMGERAVWVDAKRTRLQETQTCSQSA